MERTRLPDEISKRRGEDGCEGATGAQKSCQSPALVAEGAAYAREHNGHKRSRALGPAHRGIGSGPARPMPRRQPVERVPTWLPTQT